jgi:urease accessory protein
MADSTMQLMRLLQISDSAFPIGGYAFSHGLEAMFKLGYVGNEQDVQDYVQVQIEETLGRCDLPLLFLAHAAAVRGNIEELISIDQVSHALKTVPVYRESSQRMGRRFLAVVNATFPGLQFAPALIALAKDGGTHAHYAVAYGAVTSDLEIAAHEAAAAFAQTAIQGYVGAAVRLSIIGQSAAQRVAASLHPIAGEVISQAVVMARTEMGGFCPVIDFAGLVHAGLGSRQFSS